MQMITKLNKMVEAGMAEKVMVMMVALMLVVVFKVMGMMGQQQTLSGQSLKSFFVKKHDNVSVLG